MDIYDLMLERADNMIALRLVRETVQTEYNQANKRRQELIREVESAVFERQLQIEQCKQKERTGLILLTVGAVVSQIGLWLVRPFAEGLPWLIMVAGGLFLAGVCAFYLGLQHDHINSLWSMQRGEGHDIDQIEAECQHLSDILNQVELKMQCLA